MTPQTLRRKLQKKKKHKLHRKCPRCGDRMRCRLEEGDHDGWHLWAYCGEMYFDGNYFAGTHARCRPMRCVNGTVRGCGYFVELFWSGGGTGRRIPHGKGTPPGEMPHNK